MIQFDDHIFQMGWNHQLVNMTINHNGWFIMENPIKMDDLGIPLFLETPICFFSIIYDLFSRKLNKNTATTTRNTWGLGCQSDDLQRCWNQQGRFVVLGFLGNFFLLPEENLHIYSIYTSDAEA